MAMYDPIVVSSYKYIDPTRGVNGTGTFADPYNTWGTGGWWVENTGYLQKAETEHPAKITVYNSGPYFLGTYDPMTGAVIRDNTRHAKVRPPAGSRALDIGTLVSNGRDNISVDNMDLRALRLNTSFTDGISGNAPTVNTPINIQVRRCILDGKYAAAIQGAGILFEDNLGYGYDSCFNMSSANMRFFRNRCIHIIDPGEPKVGYDPEWDSIISNFPVGGTPDEIYIEDNYMDGAGTLKQGIHLMYNPGGAEPTGGGRVIIRGNKIVHTRQPIYSGLSNVLIENNEFSEVYTLPGFEWLNAGYVLGSGVCISLLASNCTVRGNIALGNVVDAILVSVSGVAGSDTLIEHNSGIGVRSGVYVGNLGGASTVRLRNNYIRRSPVLVAPTSTRLVTIAPNVALNANNNHYAWDDGSPTYQVNLVDYDFAGYKTACEPTAQSGDPMIDDSGAPQVGSPLILAGAQGVLGGSADIRRTTRWAPPSIGALEYVRARPTRTLP